MHHERRPWPKTALGHYRRFDSRSVTSARPSTPDISLHRPNGRYVPLAEVANLLLDHLVCAGRVVGGIVFGY